MQPDGEEPGTLVSTNKLVAEPGYHNPSPLIQLIGCANEVTVVVEGMEMMTLVDTGSQISALTVGFCSEFWLRILPLGGSLVLEGTRGIAIPYKGYVEANLTIQGLPKYNEDVLLLVIPDHK